MLQTARYVVCSAAFMLGFTVLQNFAARRRYSYDMRASLCMQLTGVGVGTAGITGQVLLFSGSLSGAHSRCRSLSLSL